MLSWHLRRIEMAAGAPLDQLPASAAAAAAGSAAPGTLAILSRRTDASAGGPAAGIKAGGDSDKGVSSLLPLVVAPGDLLLGLAAGLDMRFGCRVNRVTYGKKGVTVSTLSGGGGGGTGNAAYTYSKTVIHRGQSCGVYSHCASLSNGTLSHIFSPAFTVGETFEADAVVLAVPLGVLQSDSVTFQPELPAWKAGAIARLGCGFGGHVLLQYDSPFWEQPPHQWDAASSSSSLSQCWGLVGSAVAEAETAAAAVATKVEGAAVAASAVGAAAKPLEATEAGGDGTASALTSSAPHIASTTPASTAAAAAVMASSTLRPTLIRSLPVGGSQGSLLVEFGGGDSASWKVREGGGQMLGGAVSPHT